MPIYPASNVRKWPNARIIDNLYLLCIVTIYRKEIKANTQLVVTEVRELGTVVK